MWTKEGLRVAKAKGKLRGRKPKLNSRREAHLVWLLANGEHTPGDLTDLFWHRALHRLPGT